MLSVDIANSNLMSKKKATLHTSKVAFKNNKINDQKFLLRDKLQIRTKHGARFHQSSFQLS